MIWPWLLAEADTNSIFGDSVVVFVQTLTKSWPCLVPFLCTCLWHLWNITLALKIPTYLCISAATLITACRNFVDSWILFVLWVIFLCLPFSLTDRCWGSNDVTLAKEYTYKSPLSIKPLIMIYVWEKKYSFGVCQPSLSLSRFKIILEPVLHIFCDYLCRIQSCFHAKILEKLMPDQVRLSLTSQRSRCWREQPGRGHYRQVHYHLPHYHHHHHYYHQKSLTRTRQKRKSTQRRFWSKIALFAPVYGALPSSSVWNGRRLETSASFIFSGASFILATNTNQPREAQTEAIACLSSPSKLYIL